MTRIEELAYWINERYKMKLRKENPGDNLWAYGWSNDPYMGTVRYCNVHREDDAVTRWLAEHWRPQHHEVWEIVLARMVNYTPTLEYINQDILDLETIKKNLKDRRAAGEKVFTSAYTISTCGKSMDKIDYVIDWVVQAVQERGELWEEPITLEKCHRQLTYIDGLGSFLAAQVVADLKNTAGHPLQTAPDWWTWCAPGPGSLKGLQAFYGAKIAARTFANDIKEAWMCMEGLIDRRVPRIGMQDFQNCLCEFSKYVRVKEGGHVRNRYPAR